MNGKHFVGLVLSERQAKSLLEYARMMRDHGAGPSVARDMRAICVKLSKALAARGERDCPPK